MARRWIPIAIAATVVVGLAAAAVAVAFSRANVATPAYTVVSEHEGFELRRYEPRLVAEVVVRGEAREATNAGFRILADYIFGNNTTRAKISMTAPVDRRSSEKIEMTAPVDRTAKGDEWVIAFTMPSKYTLDTLPKPNDPRVKIRRIPSKTYAVQRFSGAPREQLVQARMRELVNAVEAAGLSPSGAPPIYARYDPPWTPGFLRRNEIFVELQVAGE